MNKKRKYSILIVAMFVIGAGLIVSQVRPDEDDEPLYNSQYYKLSDQLKIYERIRDEGGWVMLVSIKDTIKVGMADPIIPEIQSRLIRENYKISNGSSESDVYTQNLEREIKRFQSNNGYQADGFITKKLIKTLNISVDKKISQIRINMKRWKAFPTEPGKEYVYVNVPDFKLEVIKENCVMLDMNVIVGKRTWQTPQFNAQMTHLIFNPSWYVPANILHSEILPAARRNHAYFENHHMRVYATVDGKRKEIPVSAIDWSSEEFPYSVAQDPGPDNPLGVVKFLFPNGYSVYMHDTPSKKLFDKDVRAFSHGCIRLSRATDLAYYLLEDQEGWNKETIDSAIAIGKTKTVYLQDTIPVYIGYFTSWVDDLGELQFRNDIYGKDR